MYSEAIIWAKDDDDDGKRAGEAVEGYRRCILLLWAFVVNDQKTVNQAPMEAV